MTRNQAQSLWPVIRAFAEGKPLQFRCLTVEHFKEWKDVLTDNPDFNKEGVEWRVKAPVREFWVCVAEDGCIVGTYAEKPAIPAFPTLPLIHCIEVLE